MKKTLIAILTLLLIAAIGFFVWPKLTRYTEGKEKMSHISPVLHKVETFLDARPFASISKDEARDFSVENRLLTLGYFDEQKGVMNVLYDNSGEGMERKDTTKDFMTLETVSEFITGYIRQPCHMRRVLTCSE